MLWQQQQKQPEGSSKSNNNNKKQTQQTLAYLVAYFCGSLQYATFISRVRVAKGRWEQGERESKESQPRLCPQVVDRNVCQA